MRKNGPSDGLPHFNFFAMKKDPKMQAGLFFFRKGSFPELGMKLAGAVCDFTEPATGQKKLFFPVA